MVPCSKECQPSTPSQLKTNTYTQHGEAAVSTCGEGQGACNMCKRVEVSSSIVICQHVMSNNEKNFKEQYIHNISEDGGKQQKDSKVVAWGAGLG